MPPGAKWTFGGLGIVGYITDLQVSASERASGPFVYGRPHQIEVRVSPLHLFAHTSLCSACFLLLHLAYFPLPGSFCIEGCVRAKVSWSRVLQVPRGTRLWLGPHELSAGGSHGACRHCCPAADTRIGSSCSGCSACRSVRCALAACFCIFLLCFSNHCCGLLFSTSMSNSYSHPVDVKFTNS